MRVFVTGATGYIGSAVCEALKRGGHQVTGLARTPEKAKALEADGYAAVLGNLDDLESLRKGAASADAVIHTAMQMDAGAPERDRAAVAAMLDAVAGSGKPFLYTSGVWVMGDTRGRMLGEATMIHPPPLVAWRPAVEQLVLDAQERGVQGMVFRPGMVFGRKGGAVGGMFHMARTEGGVKIIGDGENHWSNIHVDDVAELYRLAVESPSGGEMFVACGGMPQQVKKIAAAVAKAAGVEDKVESTPVEAAREKLGPMADCLAMDQKIGSTKAIRFFGWTVRHPYIFDEILSGSYVS